MKTSPSVSREVFDEMHSLVAASLSGDLPVDQVHRLAELVHRDSETFNLYLDLVFESSILLTWAGHGASKGANMVDGPEKVLQCVGLDLATNASPAACSPQPGLFFKSFDGPLTYFSSGWPVAYLIATVIFAVGAVIGSITYVSQPVQIAERLPVVARDRAVTELVGRITGMVDCQWADESMAAINGSYVSLGHKYALSSGIMEITYDTGAKVILQGPVTYEIETKNGGFLAIGKLTGKVEVETARGFFVRTPTTTVTDLGTEFGIEATSHGNNVYVFQGRVVVSSLENAKRSEIIVEEGMCLLDNGREQVKCEQIDLAGKPALQFVRRLPHQQARQERARILSLTDLVASGDGFGNRVNWGINPLDAIPALTKNIYTKISSSGAYQRYTGHSYIDGVFIPTGGKKPVQLDSANHMFEFLNSCGRTYGMIWSREEAARSVPEDASALMQQLGKPHPAIILHASVGITFDLSLIRASMSSWNLDRFQTLITNEPKSRAGSVAPVDIWIFTDGQTQLKRLEFSGIDNVIEVNMALRPTDHFLTLVTIGDDKAFTRDHVYYHNPRLILTQNPPPNDD